MNQLIGFKIKLEVHEPWDRSEILFGEIVKVVQSNARVQLIIKLNHKKGVFIVSERYLEEKLIDISTVNKIHVAIGFHEGLGDLSVVGTDVSNLTNKAGYYGIGSIALA